ncbi:GNAT family N-acetyltransferase [Rhodopila sp.]|uniref:GNAT family N-acetyltransferase n=1 Tax=Rhodopila sp. TaxID=2480087 RepID=UPI003D0B7FA3
MIALIAACWSQYPGVIMDVDREMPELRALDSYYRGQGGRLWTAQAGIVQAGIVQAGIGQAGIGQAGIAQAGIAESGTALVGMIAVRPIEPPSWEICRVYVDPERHGLGLGHALLDRAEGYAAAAGARRLALWSDTRFHRAHRFYQKRGYARVGPVRVLNDLSNSQEFGFVKLVDGSTVDPSG